LTNLPLSLTHIILGSDFKQSLKNLPRSLRYIAVSKSYMHEIPKYITFVVLF